MKPEKTQPPLLSENLPVQKKPDHLAETVNLAEGQEKFEWPNSIPDSWFIVPKPGAQRDDSYPRFRMTKMFEALLRSRTKETQMFCALMGLCSVNMKWRDAANGRNSKDPKHQAHIKAKNRRNTERRKAQRVAAMQDPVKHAKSKERAMAYFMNNKQKVYAYRNNRRATNIQFQISSNIRSYIYQCVGKKRIGGMSRFRTIVGMSPDEFMDYLEHFFEPWMNRKNYGMGEGKWTIDHTVPCASFDMTDSEQFAKCFHYSNMRSMGWKQNILKRDKIL